MPHERDEEVLRAYIAARLAAGMQTQTAPLIENDRQFAELLDLLRGLRPEDVDGRLKLSGFVDHPFGEDAMRCQECMYYLVHRKWCDLPELALPVEPDWWCRLWRI